MLLEAGSTSVTENAEPKPKKKAPITIHRIRCVKITVLCKAVTLFLIAIRVKERGSTTLGSVVPSSVKEGFNVFVFWLNKMIGFLYYVYFLK